MLLTGGPSAASYTLVFQLQIEAREQSYPSSALQCHLRLRKYENPSWWVQEKALPQTGSTSALIGGRTMRLNLLELLSCIV